MIARVLAIAGSDSGGGAGIQADIKTITALGGYATSALTALTAQNTLGISAVHSVPPDFVREQIKSVLSDIGADAIKTGMLGGPDIICAVADELQSRAGGVPIVVDPVMTAKDGTRLLRGDAENALKRDLLPISALITPNVPEAEELTGLKIRDLADMRHAAQMLLSLGPRAVLVTGGHLDAEEIPNLLLTESAEHIFNTKRAPSVHTHGTGCTLASAIATFIAQGSGVPDAVERATAYVARAVAEAPGIGRGHGPVAHINSFVRRA